SPSSPDFDPGIRGPLLTRVGGEEGVRAPHALRGVDQVELGVFERVHFYHRLLADGGTVTGVEGDAIDLNRALGRKGCGRRASQPVNVYRLPVVHNTSFSGISCLARSEKFWPLQCMGRTWAKSNFFNSAITWRR